MTKVLRRYGPTVFMVLSATLLLGAANEEFRYERPVESKPGFAVLELPPEVLSATAPDLRDVRLYASGEEVGGREVAYAVENHLVTPVLRQSLIDVEVNPGHETRALVDRGDARGAIEALTFEISGGSPFLKPVVLEAGDDRSTFREIARGSIFRTENASSLRLRFAPNDRRYLRLCLDDRLSEPVTPTAVLLDRAPTARAPTKEYPVRLEPRILTHDSTSNYVVDLGRTNLTAKSIVFDVTNQVFSRQVRVFEPILFRDELSLHLVGEGRIERLANGGESLAVPISELRSARLEVEVERAGSLLEFTGARVVVDSKRIVFLAPEAGALRLLYGSPAASQPHYDLEEVLSRGMPKEFATAKLGAATDRGARSPLPIIGRGPTLTPSSFRSQRAVTLPQEGSVAYLDLPGITPQKAHLARLLAADSRQVPFVVETKPTRTSVSLHLTAENLGTMTTAMVNGLEPNELLVAIELSASAPTLFQREVRVFETERDNRGPTGRRLLGAARWEKRPNEPEARLTLELTPPKTHELAIELDNGENPPISLSEARGIVSRARIDFVFVPGESLVLLSDNPDVVAARYDLSVLAERLLAIPALPATLSPPSASPLERSRSGTRSIWFWSAYLVAAGLLFAVLKRLLQKESRRPT